VNEYDGMPLAYLQFVQFFQIPLYNVVFAWLWLVLIYYERIVLLTGC